MRRADAEKAAIRADVFDRDGACVLSNFAGHRCQGPPTPHHLKKASQGGGYTADNIVTLCSTGNTWVEDEPFAAHRLGLVVRHGDTLEDAWERMRAAGLVTYDPEGNPLT